MEPGRLRAPLAAVLRSLRAQTGISQEELADMAGLHRTYVSQLERGLKSPTLAAVEMLASALDLRPSELIRAAEQTADRSALPHPTVLQVAEPPPPGPTTPHHGERRSR